jgi:hypothetical protein
MFNRAPVPVRTREGLNSTELRLIEAAQLHGMGVSSDTPGASMMELHAIETARLRDSFHRQLLCAREQNADLWAALKAAGVREKALRRSWLNWQAFALLMAVVAGFAVLWGFGR